MNIPGVASTATTSHASPADPATIRVVLQAGGRGARLRPLTDTVPKSLVPIGGTALIERHLRHLCMGGFRDFTVIVGWLGHAVERHLRTIAAHEDIALDVVHEREPLGNIGGLRGLAVAGRPVLLVMADLYTGMDFAGLLAFHAQSDAELTLATHTLTRQIEYGQVICEGDVVRDYREKPRTSVTVCSGVAVLAPAALVRLDSLEPPVGISDLVVDVIRAGLKVVRWNHGSYWIDVNSREALEAAERLHQETESRAGNHGINQGTV